MNIVPCPEGPSMANLKSSPTGVSAIVGSKDDIAAFRRKILAEESLKENKDYTWNVVTDIYTHTPFDGTLSRAAKSGKEVAVIATGENVKKILFMEHGWTTINGITQHIEKVFCIDNLSKSLTQAAENINSSAGKIPFLQRLGEMFNFKKVVKTLVRR